jgi:hypothetical protein
MSLSLIGIILVQVYWFNTSFKNNEEQFRFHVKQVIGNVADKLQKEEAYSFIDKYKKLKDSIGKEPQKSDFLEFGYYQRDSRTNETIIYSNNIISEDYNISSSFFDKKIDSVKLKNFSSKRVTEVYNNGNIDNSGVQHKITPDIKIRKTGKLDILDNAQFEIFFKDIAAAKPLQERVSKEKLKRLLSTELDEYGVKTPFEYGIYSNGLATKIQSDKFRYAKNDTYTIPIFTDNEGNNKYQLLVCFPHKEKFLFSELVGITILSIVFTLIIIIAYSSALNQLIRQRQISEIKTDFINNMTHEFKTPIATINLALDAIKNPKVIDDKEKVHRYLQMIRDENKRMHAQVENVIPLEFGFNFGGVVYTTFSISTNGFIRLGSGISANSYINNLAITSGQAPLIAPFWDDHNRSTGAIKYSLSGTAPNRILNVGWDNINIGNGGVVSTAFGSFKIRLYESGQIEFVYGPTIDFNLGALTSSIGLTDLTSFLSITPANPATTSSTIANNAINATASLLGKKYTFVPQPQCSGTPNPGNTISNVTSICSNVDFNLSLQNAVPGYGITYQWQSSVNGINFTDIIGANGTSLYTHQTQTNSYQCVVTCSGNSTVSMPVQVTISSPSGCYCIPTYTNGKTDGDLISNVVITGTTLSNNTGTIPVNPSYTYFTGQPNYTATLEAGYAYQINVTVGAYQDQNDAVWIDYNDDSVFSPDERVGYSDVIGSNGTGTFSILLDCNAPAGTHRMRIRDVWNTDASTIDPCANYGYGEVEDYDITIIAATGCQMPFNLSTTSINALNAVLIWDSSCGATAWDVHVTPQGGGEPTGTISNPGSTTNMIVVGGLTPSTTYDFYVRSNCSANGYSSWAGPYTFTTLAPGVANDDCETATELIPGINFEEHAIVATNVGATKTIGQPNPTCAIFGFGGDVWFKTIVPADGNLTIEVQADPGSPLLDTGMSVFTGDCSALTTIGCSDDEGIDAFSRLNLTGLTPNSTIYARVWEYANDVFGTFRISAWSTTLAATSFMNSTFEFYPNPVKDILNISYIKNISSVAVFNLLGQSVLNKTVDSRQSKVDMSPLPSGTYMVKVTADNLIKTMKVIKE